jgi:hypothetical protein
MVHTTINYFLRFCQQNGMPLSNAAEPVDDDIVYSPDDEAVLVGWVLHSIIRILLVFLQMSIDHSNSCRMLDCGVLVSCKTCKHAFHCSVFENKGKKGNLRQGSCTSCRARQASINTANNKRRKENGEAKVSNDANNKRRTENGEVKDSNDANNMRRTKRRSVRHYG